MIERSSDFIVTIHNGMAYRRLNDGNVLIRQLFSIKQRAPPRFLNKASNEGHKIEHKNFHGVKCKLMLSLLYHLTLPAVFTSIS